MSGKTLLPEPNYKRYYRVIESPVQLLEYIKEGCEIKQVGQGGLFETTPEYYLIDKDHKWDCQVYPKHVLALEALELIEVDVASEQYSVSDETTELYWMSKASETFNSLVQN